MKKSTKKVIRKVLSYLLTGALVLNVTFGFTVADTIEYAIKNKAIAFAIGQFIFVLAAASFSILVLWDISGVIARVFGLHRQAIVATAYRHEKAIVLIAMVSLASVSGVIAYRTFSPATQVIYIVSPIPQQSTLSSRTQVEVSGTASARGFLTHVNRINFTADILSVATNTRNGTYDIALPTGFSYRIFLSYSVFSDFPTFPTFKCEAGTFTIPANSTSPIVRPVEC